MNCRSCKTDTEAHYASGLCEDCETRRRRYGTTNKSFVTAFNKGSTAWREGQTPDECPYEDVRTLNGKVTFSRAFTRFWFDGWQDARISDEREDSIYECRWCGPVPETRRTEDGRCQICADYREGEQTLQPLSEDTQP